MTAIIPGIDGRHGKSRKELAVLYSKTTTMSTTISPNRPSVQQYTYHLAQKRPSVVTRFLRWAEGEDSERHVGWVGITVTVMAAICFPLTMTVILMNGAVFGLIVGAMASLCLVVITNLAALPTKYTIPFFFLGTLIDIALIAMSFWI